MNRYFFLFIFSVLMSACGDAELGWTPEEYINERNITADRLENGVYIIIHDPGDGIKPIDTDVVSISYEGKLTNDVVFDSGENFKAFLKDLLPGLKIGIQEIGIGGSCTIIIPYQMGYGENENGPIPGKSTLIFTVELKNIIKTLSVDEYIEENGLTTTVLDKGVHIVIEEEGSDKKPELNSEVVVNYVGQMTNMLVFDEGQNVGFRLSNVIEGWQIGLQEVGVGGKCILIIPAAVAYGDNQVGIIPPNTPLVFDIELLSVFP